MRRVRLSLVVVALGTLGIAQPAGAVPTYREHTRVVNAGAGAVPIDAGDMNGDGRADLAITDPSRCRVHVLFGSETPGRTIDLDALASAGLTLRNVGDGRCYEVAVHAAGDVNGDGRADLSVARSDQFDGPHDGWVVFGRPTGGDVDVSALGAGGLTFPGTVQSHPYGERIGGVMPDAGLGDVNGDGYDDLRVIGRQLAFGPAVLFGRAAGGAVTLPGNGSSLLVLSLGADRPRGVLPYGDVDRNGRADLLTWKTRAPQLDQRFDLVGGRGPGALDVAAGGPGVVPLTGGTYVDPAGFDYLHDPMGDLDGDGLPDPVFNDTGDPDPKIALTSRQASPLTTTSLLAGSLVLRSTPTLSWIWPDPAGDLNRDGRADLTITATSQAQISGAGRDFLAAFPPGRSWGYVVNGRATPGTLTFDAPLAGVARLDSLPEGARLHGALAFDTDATPELMATISDSGQVVVGDLVDLPAPVDTVPPTFSGVTLDNPTISTRIPCGVTGYAACPAPRTATLSFTASERMRLTFRLVRDTGATEISSTVWTRPGAHTVAVSAAYEIPPGWLQPRPQYHRIRPGNYTMYLEARDLAGRTGVVSRALRIVT